MNIKPLHDNIIVQRCVADTKSKGGILIPDNAQEKPLEGVALAVGEGSYDNNGRLVPVGVKAGDRIIFKKHIGTDIKIGGEDLLIIRSYDVLGIVEGLEAPQSVENN